MEDTPGASGMSMDTLMETCTDIVVLAGGLLVIANLVKVCLDIYNHWPRPTTKRD